jgi:dTDP-4-amino-4,6-dideoxygalactose transaminase
MLEPPSATLPARVSSAAEIPFGRPMLGEEERRAVAAVLEGTQLTHGPLVERFEAEFARFTGAAHAVAVNSCTAALHLACLHRGIGPGDEVVVPAMTHVATAHAVELCGGRCVFVDSEPDTGNLDLSRLEQALSPRTRAVSVVHFLGFPLDMAALHALTAPRGLMVIEDCALALGARVDSVHVGRHGDAGAFSFYPIKHITTGEGGMLVTERDDLAAAARQQRAFGIDRNVVSRRPVPGEYDVLRLGHNYRMSEMAAALGVAQMARLPGFLAARADNHARLRAALAEVEEIRLPPAPPPRLTHAHYALALEVRRPVPRERVMDGLRRRGIGVSIYYPRPVPLMSYFQARYGTVVDQFPVANRISRQTIALPVGPHLEPQDVATIAAAVKQAIAEARDR